MSDYRKPVLSIDLGATFTKVSWRPDWPLSDQSYEKPSVMVAIEGETITPTLVFESARGEAHFGKTAANLKPGPNDVVHNSWKQNLFNSQNPDSRREAIRVAALYLGWLRERVSDFGIPVEKCRVRICLPAFENGAEALSELCESLGDSWENSEVLRTSEPLANSIGLLSSGRNFLSVMPTWRRLFLNLSEMMGTNSPLIAAVRNRPERSRFLVAVLDVGSYTTDLAQLRWNTDGANAFLEDASEHRSFKHGVVEQLDRVVFSKLSQRTGIDFMGLPFLERENLKKAIYGSKVLRVADPSGKSSVEVGGGEDREAIMEAIRQFTDTLWLNFVEKEVGLNAPDWIILTGGGVLIRALKNDLSRRFDRIGTNPIEATQDLEANPDFLRQATALGGSSVLFDWQANERLTRGPSVERIDSARSHGLEECSCGGRNKDCMRCSGSGYRSRRTTGANPGKDSDRRKSPSLKERPSKCTEAEGEGIATKLVSTERDAATKTSRPQNLILPAQAVAAKVDDLNRLIENEESIDRLLSRFSLCGWMGALVFPDLDERGRRDKSLLCGRLSDASSLAGKTDWYRLLSLGCLLGAPVQRRTIQRFWESTLTKENFWEATIPTSILTADDSTDFERIDVFFQSMIHRELRSQNGSGEDAELLRRTFYDIRKMHHYVFVNDLPEVFLELLGDSRHHETPVRFLKTGFLPDRPNWKGVVGQSMTSPLLFLMREFARIGLIDKNAYHPICFYMNSPARRAAVRLKWLEPGALLRYDFDSVVMSSRRVWERMSAEFPAGLEWFDLPLQVLGSVHWNAGKQE
jgi:hypothetical protein